MVKTAVLLRLLDIYLGKLRPSQGWGTLAREPRMKLEPGPLPENPTIPEQLEFALPAAVSLFLVCEQFAVAVRRERRFADFFRANNFPSPGVTRALESV